jgi:hypothetical protein
MITATHTIDIDLYDLFNSQKMYRCVKLEKIEERRSNFWKCANMEGLIIPLEYFPAA